LIAQRKIVSDTQDFYVSVFVTRRGQQIRILSNKLSTQRAIKYRPAMLTTSFCVITTLDCHVYLCFTRQVHHAVKMV